MPHRIPVRVNFMILILNYPHIRHPDVHRDHFQLLQVKLEKGCRNHKWYAQFTRRCNAFIRMGRYIWIRQVQNLAVLTASSWQYGRWFDVLMSASGRGGGLCETIYLLRYDQGHTVQMCCVVLRSHHRNIHSCNLTFVVVRDVLSDGLQLWRWPVRKCIMAKC